MREGAVQTLTNWSQTLDVHWIVAVVFAFLVAGAFTWRLFRKSFANRSTGDDSPFRFRLEVLFYTLSWGIFCIIAQIVFSTSPVEFSSVLLSFVTGVVASGFFAGLEKVLEIQAKTEATHTKIQELSTLTAESRINPQSLQNLHDEARKSRERLDQLTRQLKQLSRRDDELDGGREQHPEQQMKRHRRVPLEQCGGSWPVGELA